MRPNRALAPTKFRLCMCCQFESNPICCACGAVPRNTHKALGPEIAVVHSIGRQRKLQANASCIPLSDVASPCQCLPQLVPLKMVAGNGSLPWDRKLLPPMEGGERSAVSIRPPETFKIIHTKGEEHIQRSEDSLLKFRWHSFLRPFALCLSCLDMTYLCSIWRQRYQDPVLLGSQCLSLSLW